MRKEILFTTVVFLAIFASFASCGSADAPPNDQSATEPPEDESSNIMSEAPTEFFITANVTLTDNKLTIVGDTNLPDESTISVDVDRLYKCAGETEWNYAGLAPRMVVIKNGKYSEGAEIRSEEWYYVLSDSFRERGIPPIVEVSDNLLITVIFSPLRFPQPDSVYQIVGRNGEKLKGEQVKPVESASSDTFYILETTQMVYFPFTLR